MFSQYLCTVQILAPNSLDILNYINSLDIFKIISSNKSFIKANIKALACINKR